MSNTNYLSPGANSLTSQVSFTVIKNSQGVLTKTIDLIGDKIVKTPAANLWAGEAFKCWATFKEFKDLLNNGDPQYALCFGVHSGGYSDQVSLVTKGKEDPSSNVLARTADYYTYSNAAGVLMIDHDPSQYGPSVTSKMLLDLLAEMIPGFNDVAYIVKPSTSAGITKVGEVPEDKGGFHLYIPVVCAADIPRFGRDLFDQLWLKDQGYIALAKNGAMLVRTIIDGTVFCPERLDFIANPIIKSDQLNYCPPELIMRKGNMLDTTLLPTLTDDEKETVKHRIQAAKQNMSSHAALMKDQWVQHKVAELIGDGIPVQQAQETIAQCISHDFRRLFGDFILEFADAKLGRIRVADLLANPLPYDNTALADPVEGVDYGKTTAKFYWNDGLRPCIHSFAHGGQKYFLYDLPTLSRLSTDKHGKYLATIANLIIALRDSECCGMEISFDEFKQQILYRYHTSEPWEVFDDNVITILRRDLPAKGFREISKDIMLDSVRLVANMNKFDSAQCWLSSLCWDGHPRIENFLVDYFSSDFSDYSCSVSLYLWTALAGRVLNPGCQADMVLILFGDQGAGKSTGIEAMLPDPNYYCEIDLGERDDNLLRLMRGKLIGEISELRGLNTKDAGAIKAFVTRKTEQWTPKYVEFATKYERRIVFIGTTNEQNFLADETGNRRFLPIRVGAVDRDAIRRDCQQLWAEAVVRFNKDGILWQDAEKLAKEEHDKYRMI